MFDYWRKRSTNHLRAAPMRLITHRIRNAWTKKIRASSTATSQSQQGVDVTVDQAGDGPVGFVHQPFRVISPLFISPASAVYLH